MIVDFSSVEVAEPQMEVELKEVDDAGDVDDGDGVAFTLADVKFKQIFPEVQKN